MGWGSRKILASAGRPTAKPTPHPLGEIPWLDLRLFSGFPHLGFGVNVAGGSGGRPSRAEVTWWGVVFPCPRLTYSFGLYNLSCICILHTLPYFTLIAVMAKAIFRRPSILVLSTRKMCWNFSGITRD